MEEAAGTLLCGDLFAEGGAEHPALTEGDILNPSEAFRAAVDHYSHTRHARALIGKLTACGPTTLARMHGSAWCCDGAALRWRSPTGSSHSVAQGPCSSAIRASPSRPRPRRRASGSGPCSWRR